MKRCVPKGGGVGVSVQEGGSVVTV